MIKGERVAQEFGVWELKRKNELNLERLKGNQDHPALAETECLLVNHDS